MDELVQGMGWREKDDGIRSIGMEERLKKRKATGKGGRSG